MLRAWIVFSRERKRFCGAQFSILVKTPAAEFYERHDWVLVCEGGEHGSFKSRKVQRDDPVMNPCVSITVKKLAVIEAQ